MQIILQENNIYVLRFDRDEEVIEALGGFAAGKNITAGFFFGIGACDETILSFYDIDKKEYIDQNIKEHLEIANLSGNIAVLDGKTVIHSHGVFSDSTMRAYAGHVKKLVVSATCEVVLKKMDGEMKRAMNKDIGLNLLE